MFKMYKFMLIARILQRLRAPVFVDIEVMPRKIKTVFSTAEFLLITEKEDANRSDSIWNGQNSAHGFA